MGHSLLKAKVILKLSGQAPMEQAELWAVKQQKKQITLKQFSASMVGIVAKVDHHTLDEAPFAYKNIDDVMALQKDLVKVLHRVRPLINIKG